MRRLIAGAAHDFDGFVARHAAMPYLYREIIEDPGQTELVPLDIMVDGDEFIVDVSMGIVPRTGTVVIGHHAMCR